MQPPARCSNHRWVYIDQCDDDGAALFGNFGAFIVDERRKEWL